MTDTIKMTLEAVKYSDGHLDILDQLLLPMETKFVRINNTEDGWNAIKHMQVRGAPVIGIVGCLSMGVELLNTDFTDVNELVQFVSSKLEYLVTARPTAVNMADFQIKLTRLVKTLAVEDGATVKSVKKRLMSVIEKLLEEDIATNKVISCYGADHIMQSYSNKPVTLLTHCNAGALATAGFGTALGVVRELYSRNHLTHCYCTETRPYNQGARLTAYELVHEKIPSTLICDSMVSVLMRDKGVSAVVVGADRVVANGDTANKVGTYQLAIAAKYHGVPFYVVAPSTSVDLSLKTGKDIVIEERPHDEMTSINGIRIAAPGIGIWNPSFDVTPAELITGGIVTEFGVFSPEELEGKLKVCLEMQSK